jgi:tetratricopeptide (TPR) repeat protein
MEDGRGLSILESDVPLSQSIIWRMQRDIYVRRGLQSWSEDLVPNFATNNPFFAETYAGIVAGFFEDCIADGLPTGAPLRIVELGAGPGKFCYLFLRTLTSLLRAKGLGIESVRYCMTDCSEALIAWWRGNSYLAEFVQSGVLHFESLEVGGEVHSPFLENQGGTSSPLVVIANYIFDTLPQDAFAVKDGQISEFLVTTTSPSADVNGKPALSRLRLSYKNVPVPEGRYSETSWNEILEEYRRRLVGVTVLFPVHALKGLQALSRFSDGRVLVMAGDKGFAHEDALQLNQGPPTLDFHAPNCFSQMVNLDAIGKYFQAWGGQALLPDKHFSGLNICGFLRGFPDDLFPLTKAAYQEAQSAFGSDDLFTLFAWLNAHMDEMSVQQMLAALRLTRWDPIAFMRFFPVLARQIRTVSAERMDLRTAVLRTWDNHYPIAAKENELAFRCGVILLELRFFEEAVSMFKTSQRTFAPSAATSYNLGLCLQGLDRRSEALACMIEACTLDPAFEPARLSREKLERERC